uniref:NADH dehydrogenase [ubiquinone] 1 beta subcomplex subunit 8, mitochondrial n=1 Tax=Ciona savignyi TaxID=51511 RepID=H2ZMC0_CIOSA
MSLLRASSSILRKVVGISKVQSCAPTLNVLSKRFYDPDPTPPVYDQSLIEGEDLICLLDSSEILSPEKKARLALKYGLIPEDYHPMNDHDFNLGDYPHLPAESVLERDPHYDWDDPFYRRNYGEPISVDVDLYSPLILDTRPLPHDPQQQYRVLFGALFSCFFLWWLGGKYRTNLPRGPKQYPEHYPSDEILHSWEWDSFEKRGLEPKLKERTPVTNYTLEKYKWNPAAH